MSQSLYNFIVVSYYTVGTPYEKESVDLIRSCEAFHLPYEISAIENLGSWSKNCCYKPEFLLKMLEKHQRPLVWTDVDSTFVAPPTFFNTCTADIVLKIHHDLPKDAKSRVMSSTFFLNNTDATKRLLHLWNERCKQATDPLFFDQAGLNQVLTESKVSIAELPDAYLAIIDRAPQNPVIVHYQASRIYQKIIDGELSETLFDGLSPSELKDLRK